MIDSIIEAMLHMNMKSISLDSKGRLSSVSYYDDDIKQEVKTESVQDPFNLVEETYDDPKDDPDLWQDPAGRPAFTLTRIKNAI
jgi:hypothetical protein